MRMKPSEKQITYLLTLLGYSPWFNNNERHKELSEKCDSYTVRYLIDWAKTGKIKDVEKQLTHLGINLN